MLKIATIIVTYNAQQWIGNCLTSLKESSYFSDIFIVDNASKDQTLSIIKEYSSINLIKLKENFGFGYANNVALKKALTFDYDYFLLINQDVYVTKETIAQLIEFAKLNQIFGIICPIQYQVMGKNIDFLFQNYITAGIEKPTYFEANFVNAAAWLISKKCVEKVGYFNHKYFPHYGEDNDFCNRAIYHHFKIAILKNSKVIHDRTQHQTIDKAIALAKIKLLTYFINPNFSRLESILFSFKAVFGIPKFLFKKYKSILAFNSFTILFIEYLHLIMSFKKYHEQKNQSKIPYNKF